MYVPKAKEANAMWSEGTLKIGKHIIRYRVKRYEEGSQYSIEYGGRISKLALKENGKYIANYKRGWVIEPETEEAQTAYAVLVCEYS